MGLQNHGERELAILKEMVAVCQHLYGRNMLAAADGNVSYRISENRILITPSGRAKAFIEPSDIAVIDLQGQVLAGTPSSERLMHLAVYQTCPEARAVVHAHPPNAIAWSIAYPELKELPCGCMPEVILATGHVPIVPYARPGSLDMGEELKPFLPQSKCMILARHGALTWGESLDEAFYGMERIEHSSEILRLAKTMGELKELPESELMALRKMREEMGNRSL